MWQQTVLMAWFWRRHETMSYGLSWRSGRGCLRSMINAANSYLCHICNKAYEAGISSSLLLSCQPPIIYLLYVLCTQLLGEEGLELSWQTSEHALGRQLNVFSLASTQACAAYGDPAWCGSTLKHHSNLGGGRRGVGKSMPGVMFLPP